MRGSAGYGVFQCADGEWLTLGVIAEDHFWAAVCDALGLEELRSIAYVDRLGRVEELNDRVGDALARVASADALRALRAAGAPVAPVLRPEEAPRRDGFPARLAVHEPRARGGAPAVDEHREDPWG